MKKTYDFIVGLPDEAKQAYSREAYKKLVSTNDEYFVRNINATDGSSIHIGSGETTVNDRFLFLYIAGKIHNLNEDDYGELAPFFYMMRQVSLPFDVASKAENGVVIRPDYSQWALNDDGTDGKKVFTEAWSLLPERFKAWIKDSFAAIPKELAYLVASPADDVVIAA